MKNKSEKAKLLVVMSDTHCGSNQGLAHPASELATGNIVGFGRNLHQAWLWDKLGDAREKVREILAGDKAVFLLNGDATEGAHHGTQELIASSIDEHTAIAKQCLDYFLEGLNISAILLTKGTECHTRGMEDVLAGLLKARTGKAKDKWLFKIHGCLVDAAHHIGTSARKYLEASALSIYLGNNRLNAVDAGHEPPKVMLRAHRHCGGYYSNGAAMLGVTGGWQFLTRHGHKVVTDSIPSPTILVLDWRGLPEGSLPRVHEIKYMPPQDRITDF